MRACACVCVRACERALACACVHVCAVCVCTHAYTRSWPPSESLPQSRPPSRCAVRWVMPLCCATAVPRSFCGCVRWDRRGGSGVFQRYDCCFVFALLRFPEADMWIDKSAESIQLVHYTDGAQYPAPPPAYPSPFGPCRSPPRAVPRRQFCRKRSAIHA